MKTILKIAGVLLLTVCAACAQFNTNRPAGITPSNPFGTNSPGNITNTATINTNPPAALPTPITLWVGTNTSPNGLFTAAYGSLYSQFDSTRTNFIQQWIKLTAMGNTGWVASSGGGGNGDGGGASLTGDQLFYGNNQFLQTVAFFSGINVGAGGQLQGMFTDAATHPLLDATHDFFFGTSTNAVNAMNATNAQFSGTAITAVALADTNRLFSSGLGSYATNWTWIGNCYTNATTTYIFRAATNWVLCNPFNPVYYTNSTGKVLGGYYSSAGALTMTVTNYGMLSSFSGLVTNVTSAALSSVNYSNVVVVADASSFAGVYANPSTTTWSDAIWTATAGTNWSIAPEVNGQNFYFVSRFYYLGGTTNWGFLVYYHPSGIGIAGITALSTNASQSLTPPATGWSSGTSPFYFPTNATISTLVSSYQVSATVNGIYITNLSSGTATNWLVGSSAGGGSGSQTPWTGTINAGGNSLINAGAISASSVTNSGLTASQAVVTDANKAETSSSTTATELGYVHGVTGPIQTQLGALAPIASPTFTGTASGTFSGNGSSLTALNGTQITSGTVPAAQLPVATTGAAGVVIPDGSTVTISGGVISATAAVYSTNQNSGVVIDATTKGQLFITNASYAITGFSGLVSGKEHMFGQTISNSSASSITITGPPGTHWMITSTSSLTLSGGQEGIVAFDIWPNIRTNGLNNICP